MLGSLARGAIALIFLAGLTGAGCYRPAFEDCALTCTGGTGCPEDLTCRDGFCRVGTIESACPVGADASTIDAPVPVPDAPPGTPDATPLPDAPPGTPDAALPPDASTMCNVCDPVEQSCCTDPPACDLSASGQPFCRSVGAGSTQGIQCNIGSECAAGYSCIAPDGLATTNATTCHEFCDDDADCSGQGGFCDVPVAGTAVKACTTTCTPISHVGCQLAFACTPALSADASRWHTDCRRVGLGAQGSACTADDQCRRNLICAGGASKICTKVCRMDAPGGSGCNGASGSCTRLGTGAIFGGVEFGACL
jgi:hypothetical protein